MAPRQRFVTSTQESVYVGRITEVLVVTDVMWDSLVTRTVLVRNFARLHVIQTLDLDSRAVIL